MDLSKRDLDIMYEALSLLGERAGALERGVLSNYWTTKGEDARLLRARVVAQLKEMRQAERAQAKGGTQHVADPED